MLVLVTYNLNLNKENNNNNISATSPIGITVSDNKIEVITGAQQRKHVQIPRTAGQSPSDPLISIACEYHLTHYL